MINDINRERYCLNVKEKGIEWDDPDIILSKEIVKDPTLNDEAFLAYVAIRALQQGRYVSTSLNQMYYKLVADCNSEKEQNNRKLREKIRRGFDELLDCNLIEIVHSALDQFTLECSNIALYVKNVKKTKEVFVPLTLEEIRIIMNIPNIQVEKLLRYFAILKSTININTHIGFTGTEKLAIWSNIARKTVYEFNKILEDKRLIYIVHSKSFNSKKSGRLITNPNYYSLYEYKALCNDYAKKECSKIA